MSNGAPSPALAGSRFRTVHQALQVIPYDSGNVVSRRIPLGNLLKGLVCRLTGNLVVTGGTATQVGDELPLELLQRIELVTDTNRTIWSGTGRDFFRLAHFLMGKANELTPPVLTVGTNAFAATVRISAEALRCIAPVETYFNTRRYQGVELRVTWGDVTKLVTVGGATNSISACSLDVIA